MCFLSPTFHLYPNLCTQRLLLYFSSHGMFDREAWVLVFGDPTNFQVSPMILAFVCPEFQFSFYPSYWMLSNVPDLGFANHSISYRHLRDGKRKLDHLRHCSSCACDHQSFGALHCDYFPTHFEIDWTGWKTETNDIASQCNLFEFFFFHPNIYLIMCQLLYETS